MEDKAKKYRVLLNQYLASVNVAMSNLYSDAEFKLVTAVSSFPIEQLEKGFPAALKKQINEIIEKLNAKSGKIITAGAQTSWSLSNKKNDEFVKGYFKGKPKPKGWQNKYCQTNTDALKSFLDRKTNGMNLSERVWDYNEEYKDELENALQIGIGNGVSAKSMSKFLTKFLKNPSATVIEVDEDGEAKKIKNPAAAKPGRGVYRDPKQNAMRLARTEINMAYDTADWTRYQQLDFVVGFEVHLSGNHTVKRGGKFVKLVDICDRLAGKYPKSFKFSGWHPQCRCYVTSILKTQEEQDAEDLAKLRGEAVEDKPSKNTVTEPPQGFKDWVKENSERLEKSKSLPYFVRDNKEYFEDVEFPKSVEKQFKEAEKPLTKEQCRELTLQKAEERHAARTPEQVKDIKERWAAREKELRRKAIFAKAEERHKARTEAEIEDIKARWAEHHNEVSTIKYAQKVSEIVKDFKGFDTDVQRITSAISTKDFRKLESVIDGVKQKYKQYKTLTNLDNPLQYAKDYTFNELQSVNTAVSKTIDDWLNHYSYPSFEKAPLDHKINKLEKEIISLETSKKYPTWQIAQTAYNKMLKPLKAEKDWIEIKDKLSVLKSYKTKSKIYNTLLSDIEADISNNVDRSLIKQKLITADSKKNELERSARKRALKNTPSLYVNEQGNTDVLKYETPLQSSEQAKIDIIKTSGNVDEATAHKYNEAIYGFTYQWDYEIRQVQCGNPVTSRHGHTYDEIVERSINCERFITSMPKWDGGDTYRGMSLSKNDLQRLINEGKSGNINNLGTASWSTDISVANNFSGFHIGEMNDSGELRTEKVVLVCKKQARGTSIRFLSNYQNEHEILCSMFSRYKYVTDYKQGNITYIEVTSHIVQ